MWLSWATSGSSRTFFKYFVNLEEPFRRTPVGFETQDHTLDIELTSDLTWNWRDVEEFEEHVRLGFYTTGLANEVWCEGNRVINEIERGTHPGLDGWRKWQPDPSWPIPEMPPDWSSSPVALWEKHHWAYGRLGQLRRGSATTSR